MRKVAFVMILVLVLLPVAFAQEVDRSQPGDGLYFDVLPVTMQGYVLVPARPFIEWLGGTLQYQDGHLSAYQFRSDGPRIELWLGDTRALWSGDEYELDVAPVLIQNRFFVPLRFVAEAYGVRVDVEGRTLRLRFCQYWQKAEMAIPPAVASHERAVWSKVASWYEQADTRIGRENIGIRILADAVDTKSGVASVTLVAKWKGGRVTQAQFSLRLRRSGWKIFDRKSTAIDRVEQFPY